MCCFLLRSRRSWACLILSGSTWLIAASAPIRDEAVPEDSAPVAMRPIVVKDNALCSFGLSVQAIGDPKTKRISRLLITDVWEHSDAEKQGLKPGDEILSVNGIKVSELKGGVAPGGDLFELLINRPPGARIRLEVAVRVVKRLTIVAG